MSSEACYELLPEGDEPLPDLTDLRFRLDMVLREQAHEMNRMREQCRILRETVRNSRYYDGFYRRRGAAYLHSRLTNREIEVLRLIAEGNATKQIAFALRMTFKTVVSHRTRLMKKLGIHETASLVRVAVSAGLVSLDSAPPEAPEPHRERRQPRTLRQISVVARAI